MTVSTDSQGNGQLLSLPLTRHTISLEYVKNRLIAAAIRIPIRLAINLSYYLVHAPYVLKKRFGVTRRRMRIPSRDGRRMIRADVYTPIALGAQPAAVHVNWHGSGFVLDCFGADGEMCAYIASKANCVVIDADYRKAPEHPFPAPVNDAEDVVAYVLSKSSQYDVSRISLGGSSAGACLALVAGVVFGRRIRAVACIAPPCDFRPESRPKIAPESNHPRALPRRVTLWFDKCYLIPNADRADPRLSPCCARLSDDQLTASTVYIATGRGDTLHQDGQQLIENLQRQGHKRAILRSVPGEGHGFEKAIRSGPQKDKALAVMDEIVEIIRQSL
jgi:acetyl esterase/lipase